MGETELPARPGAYLLLIRLDRRLEDEIGRLGRVGLPPGLYGYCGSARGPGGIRARVRRHFSPQKATRWHVDRLTRVAAEITALARTDATECGLCRRLLALPGVTVPLRGFGSSDCRHCPAHLLRLPHDLGTVTLADLLR